MNAARPRLAVHGAGRMGQLVAGLADDTGFDLVGVVSRRKPEGEAGQGAWFPGLEALPAPPDVLVDFTLPAGLAAAAAWCAGHGVALVSGTTGLDAAQAKALDQAAEHVPVLHAPNFSPGVNAALALLRSAVRMLPEVSATTITDVHHVHKKDAPSGTALALAAALAPHQPEIDSRREGEVVGDHRVLLELPGETLAIEHHAIDRAIFARGALLAARWLAGQAPGRYTALDWISGQ